MALPEIRPDQNRTRIQKRSIILVLCQEEVISLQSSAQAEALQPDSCTQDWGTRKKSRIGRVKERKDRWKGREVNKVSCSLSGWDTLAICPHQEETRDKRVSIVAAGTGPLVGKLVPKFPKWSGS